MSMTQTILKIVSWNTWLMGFYSTMLPFPSPIWSDEAWLHEVQKIRIVSPKLYYAATTTRFFTPNRCYEMRKNAAHLQQAAFRLKWWIFFPFAKKNFDVDFGTNYFPFCCHFLDSSRCWLPSSSITSSLWLLLLPHCAAGCDGSERWLVSGTWSWQSKRKRKLIHFHANRTPSSSWPCARWLKAICEVKINTPALQKKRLLKHKKGFTKICSEMASCIIPEIFDL